MTEEEILEVARASAAKGRKTLVLQSGEDAALTPERVSSLVRAMKSEMDMAITLSLGEYPTEGYAAMKEAGADRYLLKHETIDPLLYAKLDPGMSYENRHRCLRDIKELGYQVGGGFMVGLPGQTPESIADDILFLRDFPFDMAGIGPFIPHPGTPLAGEHGGDLNLVLKAVALTRIAAPWLHLPATTATGSIEPGGREKSLRAGANVVMPNATPPKYRRLYEIYPGRVCLNEENEDTDEDIERMVSSLGRTVAVDHGHSYRLKRK